MNVASVAVSEPDMLHEPLHTMSVVITLADTVAFPRMFAFWFTVRSAETWQAVQFMLVEVISVAVKAVVELFVQDAFDENILEKVPYTEEMDVFTTMYSEVFL